MKKYQSLARGSYHAHATNLGWGLSTSRCKRGVGICCYQVLPVRTARGREQKRRPPLIKNGTMACCRKISASDNRIGKGKAALPSASSFTCWAMVGVGAGVLFSGHSQILRSNIQITNQNEAKNDLSSMATTLAATAELSGDSTLFCPAQHT